MQPTLIRAVAAQHEAAEQWQQRLAAVDVQCALLLQDQPFSPRQLRQQPELMLLCDEQGLWLAADGMRMQPDWIGQLPRLKRATVKNELAARACQLSQQPRLIDATAGLGHDALLMAWLGANVQLVGRHPVLWALLHSAQQQAAQDPRLAATVARITLYHQDSVQYLQQAQADVVYLDPMFPKAESSKAAPLVKKDMQILHRLLHDDLDLGEDLLAPARQIAARVIVKRPRHAPVLAGCEPDHRWLGDACRFDGYFTVHPSEQSTDHDDASAMSDRDD